MRGKTRNFLENVVAFVIFGLIIYGIYLIIINYTDIGKKLDIELPQKVIEKIAQKEQKIEEIIDNTILNNDDENKEENRFEIKPVKEKPIEQKEEEIKEVSEQKEEEIKEVSEQKEEAKKQINSEPKENTESKTLEQKQKVQIEEKIESKPKAIEKKIDEEPKPVEKEPKEEKKVEAKKEETIQTKDSEEKIQKETKTPVLTDALIKQKFALINNFLRSTKNKINEKVAAADIPKAQNPRYANIRITVLKDGSYEQLTFMDGDSEYFEQITPAIISAFPIILDEKIDDQFPRYFRMKITEER